MVGQVGVPIVGSRLPRTAAAASPRRAGRHGLTGPPQCHCRIGFAACGRLAAALLYCRAGVRAVQQAAAPHASRPPGPPPSGLGVGSGARRRTGSFGVRRGICCSRLVCRAPLLSMLRHARIDSQREAQRAEGGPGAGSGRRGELVGIGVAFHCAPPVRDRLIFAVYLMSVVCRHSG